MTAMQVLVLSLTLLVMFSLSAGTILATLAVLKTWGVEKIKIVSTIASKQGLQEVCAKNPNVEIFLAAIDDGLSEVSTVAAS
jgi:uracil phosphoribosyltransferase